jgi:hypothetical protein
VPVTPVQSEQLRMAQILDHDATALQWVADNWSVSSSPQADAEVRQLATDAHAVVLDSRLLDPGA